MIQIFTEKHVSPIYRPWSACIQNMSFLGKLNVIKTDRHFRSCVKYVAQNLKVIIKIIIEVEIILTFAENHTSTGWVFC